MKSLSLFGFVTSVKHWEDWGVFIRNQNGYLQIRHATLLVLIRIQYNFELLVILTSFEHVSVLIWSMFSLKD
jgi:hypothetical protein